MSERHPSWPASPPPGVVAPGVHPPAALAPGVHPPVGSAPGVHQPGVVAPGVHPPAVYSSPAAHPAYAQTHIPTPARPPSGLFPGPSRPVYREAHPIAAAPVLSGIGAGLLWFGLFGGLAHDLASYAWWTLVAAVSAWAVALVLTVLGDRGVAVGVALASGVGLSIAMFFVGARWIDTYDWPLW